MISPYPNALFIQNHVFILNAQILVGGISFVDYVGQSKDGFNNVPMFIVMGDSIEEWMHNILVQWMGKLAFNNTRASLGEILPQGYFTIMFTSLWRIVNMWFELTKMLSKQKWHICMTTQSLQALLERNLPLIHSMFGLFSLIKKWGVRWCLNVFLVKGFYAKLGWTHGEEVVNANTFQDKLGISYFSRMGSRFQCQYPKRYENPNLDHLKEALGGISECRWGNHSWVGHHVRVW